MKSQVAEEIKTITLSNASLSLRPKHVYCGRRKVSFGAFVLFSVFRRNSPLDLVKPPLDSFLPSFLSSKKLTRAVEDVTLVRLGQPLNGV
jgi:hypothetical protein